MTVLARLVDVLQWKEGGKLVRTKMIQQRDNYSNNNYSFASIVAFAAHM